MLKNSISYYIIQTNGDLNVLINFKNENESPQLFDNISNNQ